MMQKSSSEMFDLLHKRGGMSVALEALKTSHTNRTKEAYDEIKQHLLQIPSGELELITLHRKLEPLLVRKEAIFVTFLKKKDNGKFGGKKEFNQGLAYYFGQDPKNLSKIYVHWDEEKRFLLDNLKTLKDPYFQVKHSLTQCMPNIFNWNMDLFKGSNVEGKHADAQISMFVGYKE